MLENLFIFQKTNLILKKTPEKINNPNPFSITLPQMRDMVRLLNKHELLPDAVGILDFMQSGIEMREMAKFHFTRNLSDSLSLMKKVK